MQMRPAIRPLMGVLGIAACYHAATTPTQYALRPGGPVSMSSSDSILGDAPFDLEARLEQVPLLRTVVLPPDVREIRISDWFGMIAGSPIPYLSLKENGSEVEGSLGILYGCGHAPEAQRVKWCSRIVRSDSGLDWRSVSNSLDSLGAWNLLERCETDGIHWTDSGALLIQRLEGPEFSTYTCNTPSARSGPIGGRAKAIYDLFQSLVKRHVSPPHT